MKAAEVNIVKFLKQTDTQFIVPVYQRAYQWTSKQCDQLLRDILEVGQKNGEFAPHFIGSIVYIHDGVYSAGANYLTIIDGQQRLATLYLILLALYKKALEAGKENVARQIMDAFLINPYFQGDKSEAKLKLRPVKKDDAALKYLLAGNDPLTYNDPTSRIVQNYRRIWERINEQNFEFVRRGIDRLLFVEISLETGRDDPQRIFQSLNSTGLDLSQGDLIRNYILLDLRPELQERVYERYWTEIENYTTLKPENVSRLSDFIRHYLTLKNHEIPPKADVFDAFQARFPEKDLEARELLLADLKKYAALYARFINPTIEADAGLRKQIAYLNNLEYAVAYPFMLALFGDYDQKKLERSALTTILEYVQSYLWRRFICGLPTNVLNRVFLRLREVLESATDSRSAVELLQTTLRRFRGQYRFPTDQEFINELKVKDVYNVQSKKRTYLLERIENHNNNEPVQIEGNKEITIEHILPRSFNARWKTEIGDGYETLLEERAHTLANLTLSGNNGALGSKLFKEKRDMPEKGYRASRLYLNKYLSRLERWGEAEMDERFSRLTPRLLEIWSYPAAAVQRSGLINVFDLKIVEGKKIAQALLFGKKIEVKSFRELLDAVAKQVYAVNPRFFLSLRTALPIENKIEGIRLPITVGEKYYMESIGSSETNLRKIKQLLSRYPNECSLALEDIVN